MVEFLTVIAAAVPYEWNDYEQGSGGSGWVGWVAWVAGVTFIAAFVLLCYMFGDRADG